MPEDRAPVEMRFVSLFAGVGGFDLGLEGAGHECIAQVEIDKHCRSVLDRHWPDVPKHDDVRTAIEFANAIGLVGRTDLVCGGFPCQDVSVAGKRAGLAGERTGLFWDALAFATHVQARWILLENVPGLLTSNQGRDFGTVALALGDAGFDYLEWRVLDSQFFGVPQRRRRVFIVASTTTPHRRPVLAEFKGSEWDPSALRAQGEDPAGTVEGGIAFSHTQGLDIQASESAWPTLRSGGGGHAVAVDFRHGTLGAVAPTIQAKGTGEYSLNYTPGVLGTYSQTGLSKETVIVTAPTLTAANDPSRSPQSSKVTAQVEAVVAATNATCVRRLTPIECERLQGFPDNWTEGLADTHRYKQMGNAVTVNVAHYIGWLLADA